MSSFTMSPQVFAILSALIEDRLGIHYAPVDAAILADKIAPRVIERGFDSLLDYYYFLRYDDPTGQEMAALADVLVVNETYFFREAEHLRVGVDLLSEILAERPARVWCAASSTGEEPLTLAMMLDERGLLDRAEILASDISSRALQRARAGLYRGRSFRALPDEQRKKYFHAEGEQLRIDARIHTSVRYQQINLLDDASIQNLGSFDMILCRNVLIYFRDDLVRQIAARLHARLVPGGYLLVSASESLLRFSTALACVERGGVFFYQRGVS